MLFLFPETFKMTIEYFKSTKLHPKNILFLCLFWKDKMESLTTRELHVAQLRAQENLSFSCMQVVPAGPPHSFTSFTWDLYAFVLVPFGLGTQSHLEMGSLATQCRALCGHAWKTKRAPQTAWARTWDTRVLSFPKSTLLIIPTCFKEGSWELPSSPERPLKEPRPTQLSYCNSFQSHLLASLLTVCSEMQKDGLSTIHSMIQSKNSETLEQMCLITFYRLWRLIYLFVLWIGKIVTWVSISKQEFWWENFPWEPF